MSKEKKQSISIINEERRRKKQKLKNYLKWVNRPGNVRLQEVYNTAMGFDEKGCYKPDYFKNDKFKFEDE